MKEGKAYIGDEIAEGNKLIAYFMGEKYYPVKAGYELKSSFNYIDRDFDTESDCFDFCQERNIGIKHPDEMWYVLPRTNGHQWKYHSSWAWLMPVVEKISKIIIEGHPPFNDDQFVRVEIVPNGYVKINDLRDAPIFVNVSVEGSLIKAVWKAVVKFITWYNNKNKQS